MFKFPLGQYKVEKPKLLSVTCVNQYEVMELAVVSSSKW